MNIFIVLMLIGAKASGTATLTFIFPDFHEKEIVREVEEIREPLIKVNGVVENDCKLEIELISSKGLEFNFDVFYDDSSIESYNGNFIDGVKKLEVPIVLSGSRREVRWVNILWKGGSLVVCNALQEDLSDLSLNSKEEFEKR